MCWMLRSHALPLVLVVAFHKVDRTGADGYHAWVECGDEMLIGHCDRHAYQPIMTLCAEPDKVIAGR